ncbi:MAG: caspase family protein [Saprospiraceae bacterium]|nr:caspase family protein [Saprospiraceae bacterium]
MTARNNEWAFNGKNYLLTIAIDKYQHWNHLNNAVKDVKDFTTILQTFYQFEEDYTLRLHNEDATEDNIRLKMKELKKKVSKEDNLVIYFSGHGHFDEESNLGYWVPVGGEKEKESTYISTADIVHFLNQIDSLHLLVIVDSCFSGTLITQHRSKATAVREERFASRRIFASGRSEVVDDGAPGDNSPFAKGLISFLKKTWTKRPKQLP